MYVLLMAEYFRMLDSITRFSFVQNYRFTLSTANSARNQHMNLRQPYRTAVYFIVQQTVFNINQNTFFYRFILV